MSDDPDLDPPRVPLDAVTRLLASWRLGCYAGGAASALPAGFPVRRGFFVVEAAAPRSVIYVHWRAEDEADPRLAPALARAVRGPADTLRRVAAERAGDRVVVAALGGALTALPLRRVWEHAHAQLEGTDGSHQPLSSPELTLLDWRRVPEAPPRAVAAPTPPADLRRLTQLILPRCTTAHRRNGAWSLSAPAAAFWAGTAVTEVVRNPGQVRVRQVVTLAGPAPPPPLPDDAEFPDAACYFGAAAAGRATLFASLLWEAARALRARGVPLTFHDRAVADVRFCDGVYEHPRPVEFHVLRSVAGPPAGDGAPEAVEHRVFDGSSHSWLELDMQAGGPALTLELTPAQLPGLMDAARAAWADAAPTAVVRRAPAKDGAEQEEVKEGHRVIRAVSLNSGAPVVPASYWAEPAAGPQDTLTAAAAAQLEAYDVERRVQLHASFLQIVNGLADTQLAQAARSAPPEPPE